MSRSKGRQYTKQHTKGKSKRVRSLQRRKGHAKLERRYDLVDSPSPSKDDSFVDSPSSSKDDSSTNDDLSVSSSESESGGMKPAAKKTSK